MGFFKRVILRFRSCSGTDHIDLSRLSDMPLLPTISGTKWRGYSNLTGMQVFNQLRQYFEDGLRQQFEQCGHKACLFKIGKLVPVNEALSWGVKPKFLSISDYTYWMTRSPVPHRAEILKYIWNNSVIVLEHYDTLIKYPVAMFRWEKPPTGYYKLNFDGSFCRREDGVVCASYGFVVRNTDGIVEFLACEPIQFVAFAYEAELVGLLRGVEKCYEEGIKKLVIESDCKTLIQELRLMEEVRAVYLPIFTHIFELFSRFEDVQLSFIYREGNAVADELALVARAGLDNDDDVDVGMPGQLQGLVQSDQNGKFYYRIMQDKELLKNIGSAESLTFDGHLVDIGEPGEDHNPQMDLKVQGRNNTTAGKAGKSDGHQTRHSPSIVSGNSGSSNSMSLLNCLKAVKTVTGESNGQYITQITQKPKKYHTGIHRLASCDSYPMQANDDGAILSHEFLEVSEDVRIASTSKLHMYFVLVSDPRTSLEGERSKNACLEKDMESSFSGFDVDNSKLGRRVTTDNPLRDDQGSNLISVHDDLTLVILKSADSENMEEFRSRASDVSSHRNSNVECTDKPVSTLEKPDILDALKLDFPDGFPPLTASVLGDGQTGNPDLTSLDVSSSCPVDPFAKEPFTKELKISVATLLNEDGAILRREFLKLSEHVNIASKLELPKKFVEVGEPRISLEDQGSNFKRRKAASVHDDLTIKILKSANFENLEEFRSGASDVLSHRNSNVECPDKPVSTFEKPDILDALKLDFPDGFPPPMASVLGDGTTGNSNLMYSDVSFCCPADPFAKESFTKELEISLPEESMGCQGVFSSARNSNRCKPHDPRDIERQSSED